jgi:hypothetical protein
MAGSGVVWYLVLMSKLLDEAIKKVRELPEADQEEAAELLLSVAARRDEPVPLDEETRAAIREGQAQARRGEFVSDGDMAEFFKRHGVKPRGA